MPDDEVQGDAVWIEASQVHRRRDHHSAHGWNRLALTLTLTLTQALALTLALRVVVVVVVVVVVIVVVVVAREQHVLFVLDGIDGGPYHRCWHETWWIAWCALRRYVRGCIKRT